MGNPHRRSAALIRQAHTGVVPNNNDLFAGELLPTKMLEYVSLDIPVIPSRTRVIPQYFEENMVQFFDPYDPQSLADSIIFLHEHREHLEEMVTNAQKFKQTYNWPQISKITSN